jgi:putative tricarboxylic transport membrane protein
MFADLVANLIWTGAGLYIAWLAHDLGVGALNEPGPGMLAFGLGVLIATVGAAGFAWPLLRRSMGVPELSAAPLSLRPLRMVGLCVGLVAYIAILQPIGFLLATFAFFLLLLAVFASLSWLRAVGFSAIVAAASYVLFKFALGTQLPAGILG